MNPEFERNFYVEFSYARLIGMPLFLMTIFILNYALNDKQFNEESANIALWLYVFIVLFWGARQAAESISDELRNHTWDIQKTSAISPWSLTWGKLLGSTLFNWYGGVLCLFIYAQLTEKSGTVSMMVLYAIVGGLLTQSLSLLISLFALRKKQLLNASIGYLVVLLLLLFAINLISDIGTNAFDIIHWYHFEINQRVFGLSTVTLACGWTIVGIYRLLAQELQIRTLPWVWLLFVAFLIFYIHGLVIGNYQGSTQLPYINQNYILLIAFGICSTLTYSLILLENNSPMLMRRLWVYSQEEKWLRFFEEIPCWLISLILTLPVSFVLILFFPVETAEKWHFYPLTIFLLMLRDVGIVLFFNYAPNPKRALGLILLYWTFLYWIMPTLFIAIGADIIAALFLPLLSDNLGFAMIIGGSQVGFIGYLVINRWQETLHQFQIQNQARNV